MKTNMIRIVAAVVDVHALTLYKEDGSTLIIKQGDARLRRIVTDATPQLIEKGWAEVDVGIHVENSYADFEKEGTGTVKFFRIAKDKLKRLFGAEAVRVPVEEVITPVPPLSIGPVPTQATPAALPDVLPASPTSATPAQDHIATAGIYDVSEEDEVLAAVEAVEKPAQLTKVEHTMNVVDEILAHAVPVQHENFHETDIAVQGNVVETSGDTIGKPVEDTASDTIIAVVDGKVIPGMEKIKTQFGRAAKLGSTKGVENFLKRLAAVIEQRSHSVEDLLKFMERGDLPIAEDGSILIYKVLRKSSEKYVDCHSRKVTQFVGAYVCMDPSMVDHNRSTECSNGLHVARRGYIKSFSGDVCVLAKLAPEDVIAVPLYDSNKMRVCGYHIIAELEDKHYQLLKANRPITDDEDGKKLLALAMAGIHIRRTHEVRVTGSMGAGVKITELPDVPAVDTLAKALASVDAEAEAVHILDPVQPDPEVVKTAVALENPAAEQLDTPIDPLDVVKTVEKAVLSRKYQAQVMYKEWRAAASPADKAGRHHALMLFKKTAKVGWDKLGITDPAFINPGKVKPEAKKGKAKVNKRKGPGKTPKLEFTKPSTTPKLFPAAPDHILKGADYAAKRVVNDVELSEGSPRERITKLLAIGLTSIGVAQAILTIKKKSKKSWTILGVTEAQVADILKLTGAQP
jgi:hypothetical protein